MPVAALASASAAAPAAGCTREARWCPRHQRAAGPPQTRARTAVRHRLFLGQVPKETTKAALEKYFAQFGTVAKIDVERDSRAVKNKSFGYGPQASRAHEHARSDLTNAVPKQRQLR